MSGWNRGSVLVVAARRWKRSVDAYHYEHQDIHTEGTIIEASRYTHLQADKQGDAMTYIDTQIRRHTDTV
jgi:hypothetical protein